MKYIDTHSHLNFKDFEGDLAEVIKRCQEAEIGVINIGSNLKTSQKAVKIAKKNEGMWAAVGVHPIHVDEVKTKQAADKIFGEFEKLLKATKVAAVGETGLDYFHRPPTGFREKDWKVLQREIFERSLHLANSAGKPAILHCRDAYEDVLSILMGTMPLPAGVFHCFPGDWTLARQILDMGFYLGFTGIITFTKNPSTLEVVKNCPLDKILIETDCPYLTPDPYRGKRNEPIYVIEVAKKISELKKLPFEKVAKQTTKNAKKLFNI